MSQNSNITVNVQVTIESTPNPATLKFNLNTQIVESGIDFPTAQETDRSPLAAKLFGFPWTAGVYLGPQFVSVTKQDWVDWDVLAEPLAGLIKEHLERGEGILSEAVEVQGNEFEESDTDEIKQIKTILAREIRPVVALDGGDVVFAKYEDQVLYIQMKGSCSGCPSSQATLKEGIEVRFKELMPSIKEVRAV
ncbi:MAG: NifU family protein [Pseudobdellovibrionaceae bacterium]|jgi:Fe-S cluster biogenesis protein NfuA